MAATAGPGTVGALSYVAAATGAAGAVGADSAGPNAFSTIVVSKSSSKGLAFDSLAICWGVSSMTSAETRRDRANSAES